MKPLCDKPLPWGRIETRAAPVRHQAPFRRSIILTNVRDACRQLSEQARHPWHQPRARVAAMLAWLLLGMMVMPSMEAEGARARRVVPTGTPDPWTVPSDEVSIPVPVFPRMDINGLPVRARTEETTPFFQATLFVQLHPDARLSVDLALLMSSLLRVGGYQGHEGAGFQRYLAETGIDLTVQLDADVLELTVCSAVDQLPVALNVLAGLASAPAYPADLLEEVKQQLILKQQIRSAEPLSAATDRLFLEVFGAHPYAQQPTLVNIKAATPEILHEVHKQLFGSNRAMMAIISPLEPEVLRGYLVKSFGDWGVVEAGTMPWLPASQERPRLITVGVSRGAAVVAGRSVIPANETSQAAGLVLAAYLDQQLRVELAKYRYDVHIGAELRAWAKGGLFWAWAEGAPRKAMQDAMVTVIKRAANGDFSERQVELARAAATVALLTELDGMNAILRAAAREELAGRDPSHFVYLLQVLRTVTAEEVRTAAGAMLGPSAVTFVVAGEGVVDSAPSVGPSHSANEAGGKQGSGGGEIEQPGEGNPGGDAH